MRPVYLLLSVVLAAFVLPVQATASILEQVDPPEAHPGDEITVTITVMDANVGKFALPQVDGLQPAHDPSLMTTYSFNNGVFTSRVVETFHLVASHAGDFTIPAFEVPLSGGANVHAAAIDLHVTPGDPTAPPAQVPTPAAPRGPVIMPAAPADSLNSADSVDDGAQPALHAPRDPDGEPAKVFLVASPETTQAYVKQAIKMRIDFYIRVDALAPQDSLPTVKGSDFLVTNVSERPHPSMVFIDGRQYQCDTWFTAILPLKPGDLELTTERDTYWTKDPGASSLDSIVGIFGRHDNLAHETIPSNSQVIHVTPLPDDGKPDRYSNAVGQFLVTGDVQPASVAVGEPVTLYFVVNGQGNFNYVRSPALADSAGWKTYQPTSRMNFRDEAHTEGYKSFEQSLIPLKPGALHLPEVSFSYFDPQTKQYVSLPIELPVINVAPGQAPAPPPAEGSVAAENAAPTVLAFNPNRAVAGGVRSDLMPVYRHGWFWSVQTGAILFPAAALLALAVQRRSHARAAGSAARDQRQRSLRQEQQAMREASQHGDAAAFFQAARHVLQLQLGERWAVDPGIVSLREIEARDPALAETLAPFFAQADEIIYSGRAAGPVDFARWQALVTELSALQPA